MPKPARARLRSIHDISSKSAMLSTYEEIADGVDERRERPWSDVFEFEKTLARRLRILEIGCGSGRNTVHFASMGHRVVGLDLSSGMIHRAAGRVHLRGLDPSVHLFQGDASSLPLKDGTFDAAIYLAVLHHLPNREERLRSLFEMARCLRPGRTALISVWSFEQRRFRQELEEHKGRRKGFGDVSVPVRTRGGMVLKRFYHLFIEGELEELVAISGMEVERHFKSHDNYFVVAAKT